MVGISVDMQKTDPDNSDLAGNLRFLQLRSVALHCLRKENLYALSQPKFVAEFGTVAYVGLDILVVVCTLHVWCFTT